MVKPQVMVPSSVEKQAPYSVTILSFSTVLDCLSVPPMDHEPLEDRELSSPYLKL